MSKEMKHSGIPWIGDIPNHWELKRLQSQVVEINEKNYPIKTDYVLSLTVKDGVIPYDEKGDVGNKSKENHAEYKLAYPNTIVLNSMNILIGAVGISKYFGCVSPVYYIFKSADSADLRYLNYIMSSTPFQKYLRKYANGILEIRLRVSSEDILKRHIPVPPLSEQKAIADYLDKHCAEVDEMVSLQEKIIEELRAYRQAIITETVTRGLNPNAPMKDSGVEWIGQIPQGWEVSTLKYVITTIESGVSVNAEQIKAVGEEYGVLKTSSVSSNYFIPTENKRVDKVEYNRVSCPVVGDTIIVSRMNTPELVGAAGYSCKDIPNLFLPDRLWQVHFNKKKLFVKYEWYYLISTPIKAYYSSLSSGTSSSMQNISKPQFYNAAILLPPLSEQQEIADYLDKKTAEIDQLITIKQRKIEELKEYKKSLIYEYVTGKKEVDG